jgi:hypothetical protein
VGGGGVLRKSENFTVEDDETIADKNKPETKTETPAPIVASNPNTKNNHSNAGEVKKWELLLLAGTLIAAAFAARYTRDQSLTAVDHEQRSLRAYITFEDGRLNLGNPMSANIQIRNSGQTPAFGFTSWVGIRLIDAVSDTDNDDLFKFVWVPSAMW